MKRRNIYKSFLVWRLRNLNDKNFIIILSLIIGILAGFAAVILKTAIQFIHEILNSGLETDGILYSHLFYPLLGIILTVLLIKLFYRGEFAHGITNVLYSISKNKSIVKIRDTIYFLLGSLFTVGLGGSVGLEATLVMSGAGLGSNMAQRLRLAYRSRMLLLGCGVAGALSAFFHAPIAGVIFGLEVLMLDLTVASLIPLLLASVAGTIVSKAFLEEAVIFNFVLNQPFLVEDVPYYVLLGVFTGLVALYFTKMDKVIETIFDKFSNPFLKAIGGGAILSIMIFFFPPLHGEGYHAIEAILSNEPTAMLEHSFFSDLTDSESFFLIFLAGIILLKAVAVSITLSSGGIGGFFAPSLFLGGLSGFFFARCINFLQIPANLSETSFMLVGMAGAMSAIFHAPLTAIFLIAEISGGYLLIAPLMIVSTIAYVFIIFFQPQSIFTSRLKKEEIITHHKDQTVLNLLELNRFIERDLKKVSPKDSLGDLLKKGVAKTKRNIFPVVDEEEKLLGVVLLDDVRNIMFDPEKYDKLTVGELMHNPPGYIVEGESMSSVIEKFDNTGAWNLPVIGEDGTYIGFISKSKIFSAYRKKLVEFSEE